MTPPVKKGESIVYIWPNNLDALRMHNYENLEQDALSVLLDAPTDAESIVFYPTGIVQLTVCFLKAYDYYFMFNQKPLPLSLRYWDVDTESYRPQDW